MKARAPTGHPCGESHYRAKKTDEEVRQMRELYESWKRAGSRKGYTHIGVVFNCSTWTARDICDYRTRVNA